MKKILFVLAALIACVPAGADVNPLPEIQFHFIYNTDKHPLINPQGSELLQCKDRLCTENAPLGVYGAQKLTCGPGACEAVAYDFEPFQQLIVAFEDGSTRTSNVFSVKDTLITQVNVWVEENSLHVEPVNTPPNEPLYKRPQMWGSLALILVLELLCATAFIFYQQKRFTILYGVAVANVLTTAITWGFLVHYVAQSALLWIFCVLAEAGLIALINRKDITLKESVTLSIMMNVTSYTLGMILSFMLA